MRTLTNYYLQLRYFFFRQCYFVLFHCCFFECKDTTFLRLSKYDTTVVGSENNSMYNSVAKVWKNGIAQSLTAETEIADAKSVFVAGSDVYVAGYETSGGGREINCTMWKNGIAQVLYDGTNDAYAHAQAIFVSGSDVYVAANAYIREYQYVKVWKNGVEYSFIDRPTTASVWSIFVSNGDVYVAGDESGIAKVWKNGTEQALTDGTNYARAWSVFVSGSDVYVAGGEFNANGIMVAKVWKNGTEQALTDGTYYAKAYSIFVK